MKKKRVIVSTILLLSSCLACSCGQHKTIRFVRLGAIYDPLSFTKRVYWFDQQPPLEPFDELGIITILTISETNKVSLEQFVRGIGGNGLIKIHKQTSFSKHNEGKQLSYLVIRLPHRL